MRTVVAELNENLLNRGLALFVGICTLASVGPAQAQCLERWAPGDGGPGVNGAIIAMTLWDPDGSGPLPPVLVAGGDFTSAGTTPTSHIAAWNGTTWSALGSGFGGAHPGVWALTTLP